MRPIYSGCADAALTDTSHRGLFFERFFEYDSNWSIGEDEKKGFIKKIAEGSCGDKDALKCATLRCKEMVKALGGEYRVLETQWNFVTGMGLPHPVENGLSWHPTLGVPYLAGSGVKGLLRAWYEQWSDESEDSIRSWFGPSFDELKEKRAEPAAGNLIFLDAIPVDTVELVMDIMTPHMSKWYEKGGKMNDAGKPENVPADWHDPTPIPFLAVKKAKFLFSIAPSQRLTDKGEVKKALNALIEALEFIGAGAKTAVGYGRMEENAADKAKRERDEREAQLEKLSPEDRLRKEVSQLTENSLATMFGRDFNKTLETQKDSWEFYLSIIREIHGSTVQAWKGSKEKNREKAYKRIFGAVHE